MSNKKNISVTYSDSKLRILVEEYITMQKSEFTFKEVCSYILYRAMEEEKTTTTGLYDCNMLSTYDCQRIIIVLDKIKSEGRLVCDCNENDKLDGSSCIDYRYIRR